MLAAEWEKTTRTIQRDLDYIRDMMGLPLEYDPHRHGYYFSEPVESFPVLQISERELVSVFVAQKALQQYHGTPFEGPLRSAFQKLVSSLEGEVSVAWAELDAAISFRGIAADTGDVGLLQELSAAIRARREVEFEYHKLGGGQAETQTPRADGRAGRKKAQAAQRTDGESEGQRLSEERHSPSGRSTTEGRRVRPYHLAWVGSQWYLFGFDLLRQDIRTFVPARMKGLRVLEARFERPRGFSVDKLLKGSFGVFSGGETKTMRIWFDRSRAQLMRERKWHHSQKVKELGSGEIELSVELSSLVEIVPWILSWGEHARAVAPPELVNAVREVVGKLGKAYA